MTEALAARRRLLDTITLALVCGLSLLLLIYVGYGEARRTYEQFHLEKLVAQNRVVQSALERYLRGGLPLKQYAGFGARAARILASDETIASMAVFDADGRTVFATGAATGLLRDAAAEAVIASPEAQVRRSEHLVQVVLPLSNRDERVGSLAITMHRAAISERLRLSFESMIVPALAVSLLFAAFVAAAAPWLARQRLPFVQIVYGVIFLGMSVVVVGTLVSLYSEGAQAKTRALADSLGQRLTQIFQFRLDIGQIAGLDEAFAEYRRLNPDIAAAALTVDDEVVIHTDPTMIGERWQSARDAYEYVVDITPPGSAQTIHTAVALPADVVYRRIARSVKNFAALFLASGFLASLFLQLAGSVQGSRAAPPAQGQDDERLLKLVKPVFYVAMCLEHLSYSFLPQYTRDLVAAAGLPAGFVAAVFVAYYLCFALTLVPAGYYAQRIGQRPLMAGGLALTGLGLALLTLPLGVGGLLLGRALAGVGQGMLFIGVQSYILAVASPGRKTQGASIIVYGFQGGMIAGMAIGSLLVGYVGAHGVFNLAATTAVAMAFYAAAVVPAAAAGAVVGHSLRDDLRQLAQDVRQSLSSAALLRTIALVGIPAKAVLTGVILFALPLLMAQAGYSQEDIGQVLMIYAAGVVLASGYASRVVDRSGRSSIVLFLGAVVSGLGLAIMALTGWPALAATSFGATLQTALLVVGILTVGLAHGLINAPIVTHVADLDVARRIGASSATAAYRFLERIGHVAGPLVVGQLFLFGGLDAALLAWIGGALALFGALFLWRELRGERAPRPLEELPGEQLRDVLGLYLDARDLALVLVSEPPDGTARADEPPLLQSRRLALRRRLQGEGGESGASEFRKFLAGIDRVAPAEHDLQLVLGRRSTYELPELQDWLAAHPRCRVRIEPGATEWYCQIQLWLMRLAGPRGSARPRGTRQLAAAIAGHLAAYEGSGGGFVWIRPGSDGAAPHAPGRGHAAADAARLAGAA